MSDERVFSHLLPHPCNNKYVKEHAVAFLQQRTCSRNHLQNVSMQPERPSVKNEREQVSISRSFGPVLLVGRAVEKRCEQQRGRQGPSTVKQCLNNV